MRIKFNPSPCQAIVLAAVSQVTTMLASAIVLTAVGEAARWLDLYLITRKEDKENNKS